MLKHYIDSLLKICNITLLKIDFKSYSQSKKNLETIKHSQTKSRLKLNSFYISKYFCLFIPKKKSKKARVGVAHILLYKRKGAEFVSEYRMKDEEANTYYNPKDKDFIYF